ncbi:MAG: gamma-glutamyl-phosphate reductase, partial [Tolumonas sp.]
IPRGGANLHRLCKDQSTIPVIIGGFGVSHLYVDESADLVRAIDVIDNAKVQRPSACNALDTLLLNEKIALQIVPALVARMNQQKVTLVAEPQAYALLKAAGAEQLREAGAEDFDTEWLS